MNYYNEIKEIFINNELTKKVKDYSKNKSDLDSYYNVGKLLIEAQGGEARAKYGDNIIKEYSKKLTKELGKGYSERNLKNMRKFYLFQKGQPLVAELSWSHYVILLSLKDNNKINYYIEQVKIYNLSKRELINRIKSKEYERLDDVTKNKLIHNENTNISDFVKNPILINNKLNVTDIKENILKKLILEDLPSFMKELGDGFCFIDSEYKIKVGNNYNYIDLLLFNYIYNCFVVTELKVTELKKEHIGQVQVYMNYIDKHVKKEYHNKTIGIIIVKKDNKYIIEYSSDARIISREYELVGGV